MMFAYGDYTCRCTDLDDDDSPTSCTLYGEGVEACTPDNLSSDMYWSVSSTPSGGSDCDDNSVVRYPTASEICDGQFNDCEIRFWIHLRE